MQLQKLILASRSPRRAALLRQIGFTFEIHPSRIDETIADDVSPEEHVKILSERKAREVAQYFSEGVVLGADTIVVLDGEIINKPKSPDDAILILNRLSGRQHEVYTGITLMNTSNSHVVQEVEKTEVWFRRLDMNEITEYVASGSPLDKAGAYGIQDDYGAVFVEKVCGCFYNVVGLPLTRFYLTYKNFINHPEHLVGRQAEK